MTMTTPLHARNITKILTFLILLSLLSVPSLAGTKYMSGGPEIQASIDGTNEFAPGDELSIPVTIENTGLIDFKMVQSEYLTPDDLPNTAKFVIVTMNAGDTPIIIKSDPQKIGDVKGGTSTIAEILVKIPSDAPAGNFNLPVTIAYEYLNQAEQKGLDSLQYTYKKTSKEVMLPITIRPAIFLDIENITTQDLNVGTEGYIHLKIKNEGHDSGTNTIIKIVQNGNSPVIPTDGSIYIGSFPAKTSKELTFKASVSRDAEPQIYPLDIYAVYDDFQGDTVTSSIKTFGIPVGGKIDFNVISKPGKGYPGQKTTIEVEYKNTGDAPAYQAQARISAVDPFTSNDDSAFLGDLAPGQSAIARYEVSLADDATIKQYAIDSEVRYRDALNNNQISDTVKVPVDIISRQDESGIIIPLLILGIIIIGCGGYYVYKKKKQ